MLIRRMLPTWRWHGLADSVPRRACVGPQPQHSTALCRAGPAKVLQEVHSPESQHLLLVGPSGWILGMIFTGHDPGNNHWNVRVPQQLNTHPLHESHFSASNHLATQCQPSNDSKRGIFGLPKSSHLCKPLGREDEVHSHGREQMLVALSAESNCISRRESTMPCCRVLCMPRILHR